MNIEGREVSRQAALAVGEHDVIPFKFDDSFDADSAYGIASATVDVVVISGVDGTPNNIKSGPCQAFGTKEALQMFVPTVSGVEYLITCTGVTNEPTPRTLQAYTVLPVISIRQSL